MLRRMMRPMRKLLFPGALVVGYHRIADVQWDPLGLAVSIRNFSEQLDVLASKLTIVSLPELVRRRHAGRNVDGLVAITFDDGYRDNLQNALPLLSGIEAQATVFIATGSTDRAFWWEQIVELLTPGENAVESLSVTIEPGSQAIPYRDLAVAANRRRAVCDLCHRLRDADAVMIADVLAQLRKQSPGLNNPEPGGIPLTSGELRQLVASDIVDIGAHTVDHGCLGVLDPETQRYQIGKSRDDLQELTGRRVVSFSYPNGSLSRVTPQLVADCGFQQACTSEEGSFGRRGDPFKIPRLWSPGVPALEFEQWLAQWTELKRA